MSNSKNHYRKVFKSDYLGVADLEDFLEEGVNLVFTIKQVIQQIGVSVAGRKGDHNIAYFDEPIKPMVLNATNSKIMQSFHPTKSPFVEDWKSVKVELYIDKSVKMKGEIVGGIRIRPIQPIQNKTKPVFTDANFEKAFQAKASIEKIKEIYSITPKMEKAYMDYATEKELQNG